MGISYGQEFISNDDLNEEIECADDEIESLEEDLDEVGNNLDALEDPEGEDSKIAAELIDKIAELKSQIEDLNEGVEDYRSAFMYITEYSESFTLISDDHFEKFAEEEAYEMGLIQRDAYLLTAHIAWDRVAKDLQVDYHCHTINGTDYWVRG